MVKGIFGNTLSTRRVYRGIKSITAKARLSPKKGGQIPEDTNEMHMFHAQGHKMTLILHITQHPIQRQPD